MSIGKNKRVLITGASGDIGKECALYLMDKGYDLVLHCNKNIKKLEEIKNNFPNNKIDILSFSVADRKQTEEILKNDIENNGIYYGVVYNSGITKDNPLPLTDDKEWDEVIEVNLTGFYNVMKPVIMPLLQKREGRIIVMSSVSGITGNKGQVNYSASKAGLIGAAKALARECAKRKITVNCIAPGIIEGKMTENISEDIVKEIVPIKRKGTPKEVASLVNYLLSEDASYITGQVISVNGGLYI